MTDKYKYFIFSLIVMSLILFTTAIYFLSYSPKRAPSKSLTHVPDAIMEDVTAVIMNKEGKPKLKIASPKMVHFSENDSTRLTSPTLIVYRPNSSQPWFITAQHANATQGIENVNFWDKVNIHHAADGNNPATFIKTTTLLVHPNKQTAQTDDLITLTQPNLVVNAKGMFADMNTGDIKLISQTRGEYVPNS